MLLEDVFGNALGEIVEGCCWGNGASSTEEKRCYEVLDRGFGPFTGGEVEDYRGYCTD
jgi:hypothetical protein